MKDRGSKASYQSQVGFMTNQPAESPSDRHKMEHRNPYALVIPIFFVSLALRLICYTGLIGSDDLVYSTYAYRIAVGEYEIQPHRMVLRYGLLLPVATVYKLFGLSEWTTILVPIVASSITPAITALIAYMISGFTAAWIAGLLLASFPVETNFGSILVPEPLMQVLLLLGALTFIFAERRQSSKLGLLSGILLGLGYLVKEPSAFVVAAFVAYAVVKKRYSLACLISIGAAFVVMGEIAWHWIAAHDPLFRIHAIELHSESGMAVDANTLLSYRLFKSYPRMMLIPNMDFGLHSIIAIVGSAVALVYYRSTATALLVFWSTLPFLYLNFGSSSFQKFWALPVAPRYLMMVYPPLFLLTAGVIAHWASTKRLRAFCFTIVFLAVAVGIGCSWASRKSGGRVADVATLKRIALDARNAKRNICEVMGERAMLWRQALLLTASDILNCDGDRLVKIVADRDGRPTAYEQ